MGWTSHADGSTLSRRQKMPPFQKAVARPLVSHFLARAGVVGMRGCSLGPITGTNISDKPLSSVYHPFAADSRSGCKLGRRSQRPVDCRVQIVQLPSNALLPELG